MKQSNVYIKKIKYFGWHSNYIAVCLSVLMFCPTWGQGCVHPGSVWSKCRCILSFKIINFQKINSPSVYVVPKVCNILSLLTRVCVTTCFCGKKGRTRRRENQKHPRQVLCSSIHRSSRAHIHSPAIQVPAKRSRASSNRGLQDTPCTNPEVEAHSRSCSTGVLLDKSV